MKSTLAWLGFGKMAAFIAGLLFIVLAPPLRAVEPPGPAITFDSLTVRGTIYTRVVVVDVSKRHVSFRSAQGFSTVLIEDLDADAQARVGRGGLNLGEAAQGQPAAAGDSSRKGPPVKAREIPQAGDTNSAAADDSDDTNTTKDGGKFLGRNFAWTIRTIVALVMIGVGCLVILTGQCWLIGAAFRTSTGWGIAVIIGTFVVGIINLIFCFTHWDVAKRPVYLKLAGCGLVLLAVFVVG